MIFSKTFAEYEKLLRQKYRISSTIQHKGEKGRQRENSLLIFLRDNLPGAYGVGSGEIISYKGSSPSPQCDIIIYDRLRFPVLGSAEAVQQIPLEAVYAVIECKSLLDAKALSDSAQKFNLIRNLERCPSERPLKESHSFAPFFSVFAYSMKCRPKRCVEFMISSGEDVDVVVLGKGCGLWFSQPGKADKAIWLTASNPDDNFHQSLLLYFISLLHALNQVDLGAPNFFKMFMGEE